MTMQLKRINPYIDWDGSRFVYAAKYWKREILPSMLGLVTTDSANGSMVIPAAPAQSPPLTFKQPYYSLEGLDQNMGTPFEIDSLIFADTVEGTAAANFLVLLKEVGEVREFMNRPCHVRTIFGTAQTPGVLRQPYYLLSQHMISVQCFKISGGASAWRPYFNGSQYFPWAPEFLRKPESHQILRAEIQRWLKFRKKVTPYWLTTDAPVSLLANATAEATAKVGDDGSLELFTLTAVATGNFSVQISEVKTKQTLMNAVITLNGDIGTANFPTIFPTPYLLPAGMRLRFVFTDLSGAPNVIFPTLAGRKLYCPFLKNFVDKYEAPVVPVPVDMRPETVPPALY